MAGHSKWKQIKRAKGVTDAKRGQLFTKLTREIISCVKEGGPDPAGNFRLRLAIEKARASNMPVDNIDRAVKRASGEGGAAVEYIEVAYEGFTPGGAAIICQALTDNKTRTVSEVRSVFSKSAGKMADAGSVGFMFESKGVLSFEVDSRTADELALAAIDLGADDVKIEEGLVDVYMRPEQLEKLRKLLEGKGFKSQSAELDLVPKSLVPLTAAQAEQALRLMDKLEELDDVTKVYTNADFPAEALEKFRSAA